MKFNLKVILLGGLAFYVTQFIVSMISGPIIHENILHDVYRANEGFWRPELNQDPPDMAALMPRWITVGLITTFIITAVFDNIRSALDGSGVVKGMKFGFIAFLFSACLSAGWSGVFNLPNEIWLWWNAEALVMYLVGGAALGFVTGKLSPA
jgi:hypothetical protein